MTNTTTDQNCGADKPLSELGADELHNLYSSMLATAHDIGYAVPDELLIETDDPADLRRVIPPLHAGIQANKPAVNQEVSADETAVAGAEKPVVGKRQAKKKTGDKSSDSAGAKAEAEAETNVAPEAHKETKMAKTETAAAKTAAKGAAKGAAKAPAKGAAKKAAPAKGKGAAKVPAKGAAKKAAKDNARTGVGRSSKFTQESKITVVQKENPCREGTQQHTWYAAILKSNGKTVADMVKAGGATVALSRAIDRGWVTVK